MVYAGFSGHFGAGKKKLKKQEEGVMRRVFIQDRNTEGHQRWLKKKEKSNNELHA